ncbi:uncharacterized protein RSE6_04400 [Rhynchosporium secalis]|uniref:Uncharacterized protein n=1 Tax=Rhynchosporium secalis TaxID=38038 RepID=A0A1E1M580_RHYSE|nr:uncharacterized protein RSE6_04400 [Rhynchosporium secalis]
MSFGTSSSSLIDYGAFKGSQGIGFITYLQRGNYCLNLGIWLLGIY